MRLNRPTLLVAAMIGVIALAIAGVAIAQTDSDAYTGCLTATGNLKKVAIGDDPARPCSRAETEIHWNEAEPAPPVSVNQRTTPWVSTGGHQAFTSDCEPGEILTGGGYSVASIGFSDKVFTSGPYDEDTWLISVFNDSGYDIEVWVTAMCLATG